MDEVIGVNEPTLPELMASIDQLWQRAIEALGQYDKILLQGAVPAEVDPELVQLRKRNLEMASEIDGLRSTVKDRDEEIARLHALLAQEPMEGVSGDWVKEMATALGLAEESPPATMLAKAKALMAERGKKPAAKKKVEPQEAKPEPPPSNVTPIRSPISRCEIHPKGMVRPVSMWKFCDECGTLVKHTEKIG